ncbi:hypothetical protein F5Y07DRAFT_305950 [Xylaria sp. FL0933]|nr:hypothetical protein F5Y07DRAFT_305950 [Xylaria sp. FL0933]
MGWGSLRALGLLFVSSVLLLTKKGSEVMMSNISSIYIMTAVMPGKSCALPVSLTFSANCRLFRVESQPSAPLHLRIGYD